eukprot:gene7598-biopygen13545
MPLAAKRCRLAAWRQSVAARRQSVAAWRHGGKARRHGGKVGGINASGTGVLSKLRPPKPGTGRPSQR